MNYTRAYAVNISLAKKNGHCLMFSLGLICLQLENATTFSETSPAKMTKKHPRSAAVDMSYGFETALAGTT